MKQIPLATKSLRHKDTQSKENQQSKFSVHQLKDSDFVTLWRNNFLLNCNLVHIALMKQIPLATKPLRHKDTQSKENQ